MELQLTESNSLFVAREEDLSVLQNLWSNAASGSPQMVRLQAPFGGGRRALSGEFLRRAKQSDDNIAIWRANCMDQENGLQWLIRMYGSLVATLSQDVLRRGRVEMLLNAQLPDEPKRVQSWYQEFIATLKESKPDAEKGSIQLRLPRDNPLLGLVEVVVGISRKMPIILEIQNPYVVYSVAVSQFLEALMLEARETDAKLLVILFDEPETDTTKSLFPVPLLDFYSRRSEFIEEHAIVPWGGSEALAYLQGKEVANVTAETAETIANIAQGRPGFIAELADILTERNMLDGNLDGVSFASLMPLNVDETELETSDAPVEEGERRPATASDAKQVAYLAALLGQAFPSALVADMGGFERDSIDDLIDAMEDMFEEVQFSKDLGSWIYKFKRGSWREGVLEAHDNDEGHEMARKVGVFMERFLVPRGYGFIVKTARIYAENGAANRANGLRSMALSNDAPDVWGLCFDITRYFDEIEWPTALRRTLYMNLLDNMVSNGPVQAADQIHQEATVWAAENEDRELTAWLLFTGSRLDTRRQDYYRARDRANDALKLYTALDNNVRAAEIHNHIAGIELQDGKLNEAMEEVGKAIELGQIEGPEGQKALPPGIFANAEHIRGMVLRRSGKPADAVKHFRNANEAAGRTGIALLALDSGLAFGEALMASGQTEPAREALDRVIEIARQLKRPVRERSACELAAQAYGAARNFPKAVELAGRTVELSQALKFGPALPIDLYNLGFFLLADKKPKEALDYFRRSEQGVAALGDHPVSKELFYFMGMALLNTGDPEGAKKSLTTALPLLENAKDWKKLVAAMVHLAGIAKHANDTATAKSLLDKALEHATGAELKEERKEIKKRLANLD